ncbi:hypothetical protein LX64_00012 [Chitinophaga skermanii]|uniref:Uncharacterized protein n=1 Tax=Chitinophaga skermanii TaxID=331697 RepID=A0A327R188_9BACT|nr:hypothetical protein [Chitinophaga skermanii]RAJ10410.1 hypothetical protein LX64_00012 [Chitinophaga skermanii]
MQPLLPQYISAAGEWLTTTLDISVPNDNITESSLVKALAQKLEALINNDFEQFVYLLYRVDVSENKVKELLATGEYPEVYYHIARLIIDRQIQKWKSREAHKNSNSVPGDDEEKW